MRDKQAKTARLEARLPESVYSLLRQAASIQGRSLSEFVVSSAREAAERAIAEHEVIKLSIADQEMFAARLLAPQPMSTALERAAEHHRELVEPS